MRCGAGTDAAVRRDRWATVKKRRSPQGRKRVVGPVIPEATLRRLIKSRKPLPREHSERLYAISRVIDAAARAWHGDRAATLAFLDRPHPLLAGQSPLDMARSSTAGADAVLALIRRAEAGIAL